MCAIRVLHVYVFGQWSQALNPSGAHEWHLGLNLETELCGAQTPSTMPGHGGNVRGFRVQVKRADSKVRTFGYGLPFSEDRW